MFKIIITHTDHTTDRATRLTDPRRYKKRKNAEKAAQKIGYVCKPDGKTIIFSIKAEVEEVRPHGPSPAVGERYTQNDGGMAAIVKAVTGNRVVFSYEQYPEASHDYSLCGFIREFTLLEVCHA
jgi:hypothetical protein